MPYEANGALLDAIVPGFPPAQMQLEGLRRVNGVWQTQDVAVRREVTMVMRTSRSERWLSGRVFVDGLVKTPSGLSVIGKLATKQLRHASIIDAEGRYALGPLDCAVTELWITSNETVPLVLQGSKLERVVDRGGDAYLESCLPIRIQVVDAVTRVPLSGVRVEAHSLVPVAQRLGKRVFKPARVTTETDREGLASLTGMPADGSLRMEFTVAGYSGVQRQSRDLAEVRSSSVNTIEVESHWNTRPAFGPLPPLADRVRYRMAAPALDASTHDAAIDGTTWSIPCNAATDYTVWAESKGCCVTEMREFCGAAADEISPINLEPMRLDSATLRWSGLPPGCCIEYFADVDGVLIAQRTRLENVEASGSATCVREDVAVLHISVTGPGGAVYAQSRSFAAAGDRLELSSTRRVQFLVNGARHRHDGQLSMQAIDEPMGSQRVMRLALVSGESAQALAAPGRYFYRLEHRAGDALLVGTIDIRADGESIEIDCPATHVSLRELSDDMASDPTMLVLVQLDGVSQLSNLHAGLRELRIDGREATTYRSEGTLVWIRSSGCTYACR